MSLSSQCMPLNKGLLYVDRAGGFGTELHSLPPSLLPFYYLAIPAPVVHTRRRYSKFRGLWMPLAARINSENAKPATSQHSSLSQRFHPPRTVPYRTRDVS